MRKKDVEIGGRYWVKVSGKIAPVRIVRESPFGGWEGVNEDTGRKVRIKTAGRLRSPVGSNANGYSFFSAVDGQKGSL